MILYAPDHPPTAGKEIVTMGAHWVRTIEELLTLLARLRGA